ncbi:SDR family NAD(P)-dependent oxidoreductase [uncultured Caulobacter sp.]|uniref:SDR family NAD(P)-dependent oxidoreductase n=1 Tax=uncultured Caulobacter sp. TaxID=158749 RepID=UPI0026021F84|nr:SDR family NAD(P)-dependent oxidoreductase [uncultured Caulobacter sp.]
MAANGRKSIFITGAASGIGLACAKRFASAGWFIGLSDIDKAGLAALSAELGEDRVLRQLLGLAGATLRTNHWRTGVGHSGAPGPRRAFLSFKFDSAQVPGLPSPRPFVEIFVKDLGIVQDMARAARYPVPLAAAALGNMRALHGDFLQQFW